MVTLHQIIENKLSSPVFESVGDLVILQQQTICIIE